LHIFLFLATMHYLCYEMLVRLACENVTVIVVDPKVKTYFKVNLGAINVTHFYCKQSVVDEDDDDVMSDDEEDSTSKKVFWLSPKFPADMNEALAARSQLNLAFIELNVSLSKVKLLLVFNCVKWSKKFRSNLIILLS
jgi:hypothetical protein